MLSHCSHRLHSRILVVYGREKKITWFQLYHVDFVFLFAIITVWLRSKKWTLKKNVKYDKTERVYMLKWRVFTSFAPIFVHTCYVSPLVVIVPKMLNVLITKRNFRQVRALKWIYRQHATCKDGIGITFCSNKIRFFSLLHFQQQRRLFVRYMCVVEHRCCILVYSFIIALPMHPNALATSHSLSSSNDDDDNNDKNIRKHCVCARTRIQIPFTCLGH